MWVLCSHAAKQRCTEVKFPYMVIASHRHPLPPSRAPVNRQPPVHRPRLKPSWKWQKMWALCSQVVYDAQKWSFHIIKPSHSCPPPSSLWTFNHLFLHRPKQSPLQSDRTFSLMEGASGKKKNDARQFNYSAESMAVWRPSIVLLWLNCYSPQQSSKCPPTTAIVTGRNKRQEEYNLKMPRN